LNSFHVWVGSLDAIIIIIIIIFHVPKHKNSLTSCKYSFRQWTANYKRAKNFPSLDILDIQVDELVGVESYIGKS